MREKTIAPESRLWIFHKDQIHLSLAFRYMGNSKFIPRRYRGDIPAIETEYGNLVSGKVIEAKLKDFAKICQRDYVKVASYIGLSNFLFKKFGVILKLSSQKTKSK